MIQLFLGIRKRLKFQWTSKVEFVMILNLKRCTLHSSLVTADSRQTFSLLLLLCYFCKKCFHCFHLFTKYNSQRLYFKEMSYNRRRSIFEAHIVVTKKRRLGEKIALTVLSEWHGLELAFFFTLVMLCVATCWRQTSEMKEKEKQVKKVDMQLIQSFAMMWCNYFYRTV
jgi:hypothetical protein